MLLHILDVETDRGLLVGLLKNLLNNPVIGYIVCMCTLGDIKPYGPKTYA